MQSIEPVLPDLETTADIEISKENLNAVQAIYFAYMLEQMRMFQVVDRIIELFRQGLLPLGRGSSAGAMLGGLARERLSTRERAGLYARVLGAPGAPGGSAGESASEPAKENRPNRQFLSLWLRFMVSVAMYSRLVRADNLLHPPTLANAAVRRAARDLAVNASLHGWGVAAYAARLASDVKLQTALLSDPEILGAFGARDMFRVIEKVNRQYLGGAVNVVRYRTQAHAGRLVLQWLAANSERLGSSAATAPADTPADGDLIQAVDEWLAVGGVAESLIERYSQPGESPVVTSKLIDLPAIAADLLEAVGLSVPGGGEEGGNDAVERLRRTVAVFQGAADTGKTLAAHVLAAALSRDILRVDLSRVVSQYIGEAEKNIDAVFADAERTGAVLFFDEADALFGGRTEVKDLHDRYANLDVAYLLQRIEAFNGVVVLASNTGQESDDAQADDDWRRRLRQAVRFPRPRPPK